MTRCLPTHPAHAQQDRRGAHRLDAGALVASLKQRIANFKVPKHLFIAGELPRNAMGKVQKNLLRQAHEGVFAT